MFNSHPFSLTVRKDCIEVSHAVYREVLPTIKAVPGQEFDNFDDPTNIPAFFHYQGERTKPISLAIFPFSKPARYFIFLTPIPFRLHRAILRMHKNDPPPSPLLEAGYVNAQGTGKKHKKELSQATRFRLAHSRPLATK